jgi:hypothetical protein
MSPNAGGGGKVARVSPNGYSCAHGAPINFGDLSPYFTLTLMDSETRRIQVKEIQLMPGISKSYENFIYNPSLQKYFVAELKSKEKKSE